MTKNRSEGQIWIDRNSPYKLKYYVHGEEFEVSVSQNYNTGETEFTAGNVVKIGDDGRLIQAIFPQDIDRVIGVVSVTKKNDPNPEVSDHNVVLSVIESDNLLLFEEDIRNIFREDLGITASNVTEKRNEYIGAPVYWFIGISEPNGSGGYNYIDSSDELEIDPEHPEKKRSMAGLLTLNTPSGYQWKQTQIDDDSLNVGYSNLPTIGHVSRLWLDEEDNQIRMIINLHMTGFQNVMEWSWPHFYSKTVGENKVIVGLKQGYSSASSDERGSVTIPVRHGLFPKNRYENNLVGRVRCFCDVIAMPHDEGSDREFVVQAAIDNYIGHIEEQSADSDKRTEIIISTPEDLRYSITGRVLYDFNKEVVTNTSNTGE